LIEQATTQTAATVQSTTAKRQYVFGSYVDELVSYTVNTTRYYVHANHLYSPSAITNASGVVVERMRYDAYGKQTITTATGTTRNQSAVGFSRGFTGYILDEETGLYYARARMYSAGLGRFVGRDPAGYVDGLSVYDAYYSPNGVDPTGMTCDDICGCPYQRGYSGCMAKWRQTSSTAEGMSLSELADWTVAKVQSLTDGPFDVTAGNFSRVKVGSSSGISISASALGMKCPCCKEDGSKAHYVTGVAGVGARVSAGIFVTRLPVIKYTIGSISNNPFSCPDVPGKCPVDSLGGAGLRVTAGADVGLIIAWHGTTSWFFPINQTHSTAVSGSVSTSSVDIGWQGGAEIYIQVDGTVNFTRTIP